MTLFDIRTGVLRCTLLATGLLALGLAVDRPVVAQNDGQGTSNIFRPAPRELSLRISRAKKAIEAEEYSDAVLELGRLLAELEQPENATDAGGGDPQDYFVGPRNEQGTHVSLKTEAQRLIGSMPAKGREWYELQFGAEARKMLDDAVAAGSADILTNVSRRYFHTKAGYEATLLLGRYHVDQGQPLAAALCFRRLAESPVAAQFEPELSLLIATSWLQANMPDKAKQTLADLAKRGGTDRLRVGTESFDLARDEVRALAWLTERVGSRFREGVTLLQQWTLHRGDSTRSVRVAGDAPLASPRWNLPTVNNPNDEKLVEDLSRRFLSQGTAALPALQPLVVGDFVLMRTNDSLMGVDRRTGKRIWPYPWDDMETNPTPVVIRGAGTGGAASMREVELRQRIWEDAPYGQISSDGQAVFLLHGMGVVPTVGFNAMPFIVARGGRVAGNRLAAGSTNRLVALDVKREGKHLWVIGDADGGGGDEPRLAGAFFLGAPLPLQGQLYALVELNSEIRLVVLDPRTGELQWQQQLAQLEQRNILVDAGRRLAGASPSFADGVLVCPTSAGAIVAVDIATRTLLWGFQYNVGNTNNQQPGAVFFPAGRVTPSAPIGQRWVDATVTIHDGRVLLTPVESGDMICLDLLTGRQLWPAQKRGDLLYLGCVHDSKAVFVGRNNVVAVGLNDGKPAWANPVELPQGGLTSGRGFYSEHFYYVPTTASHLVKIDLDTGKIDQTIKTDRPLGNLICHGTEIISHGPSGLAVYPMIGPLRQQVAATLEKNPTDLWALARLAELQSFDGKRDESLAILRRVLKANPADQELKELLVRSLMAALKEDFAKHRPLAVELESLVDQPSQREDFLRTMAIGLRQVGETDEAFGMLLKLVDLESTRGVSDVSPPVEPINPQHSVRRDRWVVAQLASLYRAAKPEVKSRIDETLVTRQKAAEANGSLAALRHQLRFFGFHPGSATLRLTLATKLMELDSPIEAEILLAGLESHADRKIAGGAVAVTARLLTRLRQYDQAALYFGRLETEFADVECASGATGKQLAEEAWRDASIQSGRSQAASKWPYGKVTVTEGDNAGLRNASYGRPTLIPYREVTGPTPTGMTLIFDQQRNQSLIARDGNGRELLQVSLNQQNGGFPVYYVTSPQVAHARTLGHLAFVHMGIEVVAVNTLRDGAKAQEPLRWRSEALQRVSETDNQPPRASANTTRVTWGFNRLKALDQLQRPVGPLGPCTLNGVYFQRNRELLCVDPLTGEPIWTRSDFPQGCELFGDEELVFVIPPDGKEMSILSALDGQTIDTRPIDAKEQRWMTVGRKTLAWTEGNSRLSLKLYDSLTGEVAFAQEFPEGSRGTVLETDDVLAVCQPDGQITLVSLRSGQPIARVGVEPQSDLESIYVQKTDADYLVITSGPQRATNGLQAESVPGSTGSPIINGRVYSFDQRTGKARWTAPANVEQFGLLVEQPTASPLLIFMRNARKNGKVQSALLGLDKRDGRAVLLKDEIPVQTNFFEILARPEQNSVNILMGAKSFDIKFTADPIPPEPPAQLGTSASSIPSSSDPANSPTNATFNVFGPENPTKR